MNHWYSSLINYSLPYNDLFAFNTREQKKRNYQILAYQNNLDFLKRVMRGFVKETLIRCLHIVPHFMKAYWGSFQRGICKNKKSIKFGCGFMYMIQVVTLLITCDMRPMLYRLSFHAQMWSSHGDTNHTHSISSFYLSKHISIPMTTS